MIEYEIIIYSALTNQLVSDFLYSRIYQKKYSL